MDVQSSVGESCDGYSHRDVLERKWAREDDLINQRLTWLMVSQTLLFSAYAALYYAEATTFAAKCDLRDFNAKIEKANSFIPLLGAVSSGAIWIAVFGAVSAMLMLWRRHEKVRSPHHHPIFVSRLTTCLGLVPALIIPLVFAFVWLKIGGVI
jgi:hypothetical protein